MRRLLRFLFGAALGASVAMLATPKTGRELREQLLGPEARKLMPAPAGRAHRAARGATRVA